MIEPPPIPEPKKSIHLGKLAALLAVIAMTAFGLCSVFSINDGPKSEWLMPLALLALLIEGGCLIGLLVVGGVALTSFIRRKY